ncbi:MAG: TonB-dependent receptor, partial [Deltaproteobacteria bacterium]|nr:TonB-dependent receptor [Deltaproteobacteria bacterium]
GAVDTGTGRAAAEVTYPFGEDAGFWISGGGIHGQPGDFFSPARLGSAEAPDGVARGVGGFAARTTLGKAWWRDLTFQWYYHSRDKQVATGAYRTVFGAPRTRMQGTRAFAEVRWEPAFGRNVRLMARTWYDHYGYEGAFAYRDATRGMVHESHIGHWIGVEARTNVKAPWGLRFTGGGGYENRFLDHSEGRDQSGRPTYLDEDHTGQQVFAYASADWGPAAWVLATAGVRFDGRWVDGLVRSDGTSNDRFMYSVNPRAALRFHPVPEGTLKLMAGRAFRAPSVYELTYSDGGVTQARSPDLDPESIWTGEVEYSHRLPEGFTVLAAGFMSRVAGLIEAVGGGPGVAIRLVNATDALWTAGAEAEVRREFRGGWLVSAQYSFQRSRFGGIDGTEPQNAPEHIAALKLVAPIAGRALRVATRAAFETGRLDRFGDRTPRALVWDLALSGEVAAAHLRYAVGARNLLDWRYSHPLGEEVDDPRRLQPGRTLFAELGFFY